MTRCAIINCANSTNKGEAGDKGISFHCFPNDPHIKNKWIEATGRKNWFPTKHSKICSIHFHEDVFTALSKNRRLFSTAYPTIDVVIISNKEKMKNMPSLEKDSKNNIPRKRKLEVNINEPSTSDETPIHTPRKKKVQNINESSASDETPVHTPREKKLLKQLQNVKHTIKAKDKQIKRLREQNRRKGKQILTLMALLSCLKKKTLISDKFKP